MLYLYFTKTFNTGFGVKGRTVGTLVSVCYIVGVRHSGVVVKRGSLYCAYLVSFPDPPRKNRERVWQRRVQNQEDS